MQCVFALNRPLMQALQQPSCPKSSELQLREGHRRKPCQTLAHINMWNSGQHTEPDVQGAPHMSLKLCYISPFSFRLHGHMQPLQEPSFPKELKLQLRPGGRGKLCQAFAYRTRASILDCAQLTAHITLKL